MAESMAGGQYDLTAIDPTKPLVMSDEEANRRLKFAAEKNELEMNVQHCQTAGIQWLETNKDIITFLCNGKFPDAGYMIYKNIRLCLPGTAQGLAKKEKIDFQGTMFIDKDGKAYYGTPK